MTIFKKVYQNRLSTYRNHGSGISNKSVIINYVLNAKISENFYFLLQNLEVSLRNAIYDSFKKHYIGNDFFYISESDSRNRYYPRREKHSRECWKMLCGVKYSLRNITSLNDGKIISELNFGFWTELLLSNDQKYTNMWRKIFSDVFPNYQIINSVDRDKTIVARKIDQIRKFRNRIFHYEPVFNQINLEEIHQNIVDLIGWINKDMQELSLTFDEFHLISKEKNHISKQFRNNSLSKKRKILKMKYRRIR